MIINKTQLFFLRRSTIVLPTIILQLDRSTKNLNSGKRGSFDGMNHIFTSNVMTVHALTNVLIYTAHGLMRAVVDAPLKCYCGIVIDKPVPCTLYVKQIKDGLRKKMLWVPFHEDTRAVDVYKAKNNWNSLLDNLNGDNELRKQLGKIKVENEIRGIDKDGNVGKYRSFPVKIDDKDDNHNTVAQIIPIGGRSLIVTQNVNESPKDIEPMLKSIQRLYQIVDNYNYSTPVTGVRFRNWPNEVLEKIDANRPKTTAPSSGAPPPSPPSTAPPQLSDVDHSSKVCPTCGVLNPSAQKFCGDCGSTLDPQSIICTKCGSEASIGKKFCGMCGNPLGSTGSSPVVSQASSVAPPVKVDPFELAVQRIKGGRNAQWKVRHHYEGKDSEKKLWNIANEGYLISFQMVMSTAGKIREHNHYKILESMREVRTPTGERWIGGFMNFFAEFNAKAPQGLRNRGINVLVLPSDEGMDTPEGASVRLVASSVKDLTLETFKDMLRVVADYPGQVNEYVVVSMPEPENSA